MKKRYALALFIFAMMMTLAACLILVHDRQTAAQQAQMIVTHDQAGQNVDTEVLSLKAYAASHMKVNVQFYLSGSYNRAVTQAKEDANKSNAAYSVAQKSCDKPGVDSIRQARCVAAYLASHGGGIVQPKLPDKTIYIQKITGPNWTLDVAGLIFILSAILATVAVVAAVHRAVTN